MTTILLTGKQRIAWRLWQQGWRQQRIADYMGIERESANRLIARANSRVDSLRRVCLTKGEGCALLEMVISS